MTEKQIEQLKSLLSQSSVEPSAELDQRILDASNDVQPNVERNARFNLWKILPLNALRSASVAVAITAIVFIGLGQMISPTEQNSGLASNTPVVEFSEPAEIMMAPETIQRPIVSEPGVAPSSASRDGILMEFDLSNAHNFLIDANIEFLSGEQALFLALADINSMIQVGEFQDARERYAELQQHCVDCRLPNSLEMLVANANQHHSRIDSGTG